MNDPRDSFDPVARLLRQAGRRTGPSPEAFDRIRSQVHADWRGEIGRRRRTRWSAIAASLVALIAGGWWVSPLVRREMAPSIVAKVVRGGVGVTLRRAERSIPLAADLGMIVEKGDRVSTTDASGAAFAIEGQVRPVVLRLASSSTLEWLAPDEIRLLAGSAYLDVDTRGNPREHPVVLEAGNVRIAHVGTKYLTSVLPSGGVVVAVREGRVRVENGNSTLTLDRGERVRIREGMVPERSRIDADDAAWAWIDALAPAIPINGRSLLSVLRDLAAQSGFDLAFADGSLEAETASTSLQGPDLTLPPGQAIQRILSTTLFRAEVDGASGRIVVRRR